MSEGNSPVLQSFGLSDIGCVRTNNEDAWKELIVERFFILADGMGGHLAGEVAASELVKGLTGFIKKNFGKKSKKKRSLQESLEKILHGILQVNTKIFAMSYTMDALRGMGTTLCFLFFHEEGVIFGHVGDSRIYRLRKSNLQLLTRDHSLLMELLGSNKGGECDVGGGLYKNILTKAVGTEPEVEPTVEHESFYQDDIYLLSSDGLTDMLSFSEIENILRQDIGLDEMGNRLVEDAKKKGGVDNITVVLVKVLK